MEENQPRRFRWLFQFSLFALMTLTSCVAGYLGGYRWGMQQQEQDVYDATIFPATYYVADLVTPIVNVGEEPPGPDFDSLIELITSTIDSDVWSANGNGESEIRPYPGNLSLVVSAPGSTHDQIEELLNQLRRLQNMLPEDFMERVRTTVARKLPRAIPLKVFHVCPPEYHQRLENFFDPVTEAITKEYGRPSLEVASGERGFPEWAVGQRVAVWNRWGGKLYLSLQDCHPQGEALVAGWWQESFGPLEPMEIDPRIMASAKSTLPE